MNQRGQTILIATIILTAVVSLTLVLLSKIVSGRNVVLQQSQEVHTQEIAEAGIEYAIDQFNANPSYNGATSVPFSDGEIDITVSTSGSEKIITSTAYYPTKAAPERTKQIEVTLTLNSHNVSFNYGVQVGEGGLILANNSQVNGNVYSNGNITGTNGSRITGDAIVAGGTAENSDAKVEIQTSTFDFGNTNAQARIAQSFKPTVSDTIQKVQLYVKKTHNNTSNATVEIVADNAGTPGTTVLASGTLLSSAAGTSSFAWITVALSPTPTLTSGATYWIVVRPSSINSSRYWVSGSHDNSGYGNGIGRHYNSSTSTWLDSARDYNFRAYMGGIITYIQGVSVGVSGHTCNDAHYATHHGNAYAHEIRNSTIECDAFYDSVFTGSTAGRTQHPGSPDQPLGQFPISDGAIADWKAAAQAGGITTGNVTIASSGSLGPQEITGNLAINDNVELEIQGTVYVHGSITMSNNAELFLAPGYGATSGIIVADGKINPSNNVIICGSYYNKATNTCVTEDPANPGNYSYILMLTTDTSTNILDPSVRIANNVNGVILYAPYGTIALSNNSSLNEAVAYKLSLENNSIVDYDNGLANTTFVSGPGASLTVKPGSWHITD